ncbi:unnamed protein product [Trichobilharzia regenti]|nr:unnamed protein product [Trichobilharzia regenti]
MRSRHRRNGSVSLSGKNTTYSLIHFKNLSDEVEEQLYTAALKDIQASNYDQLDLNMHSYPNSNSDRNVENTMKDGDSPFDGKSICGKVTGLLKFPSKSRDEVNVMSMIKTTCKRPIELHHLSANTNAKKKCRVQKLYAEPSHSRHDTPYYKLTGSNISPRSRSAASKVENSFLISASEIASESELVADSLGTSANNPFTDYKSHVASVPYSSSIMLLNQDGTWELSKKSENEGLGPLFSPHDLSKYQAPSSAVSPNSSSANSVISVHHLRCHYYYALTTFLALQRHPSPPATSSLSAVSAGLELSTAAKERCAQLRQYRRAQSVERQPLPALHLHLSKDGTSPLPPGWQRAPNMKRSTEGEDTADSSATYAYYYYHVRTRQTRWDPPVYPWDADPTDTLLGETGEDDPEAPYNWGCASRFAVTHEEIEAMYSRVRQRILERQCIDLLHELAGRPDAPQGVSEQGFAIELFTLVHNILRNFRDARCKLGRIVNDEDLYYLTKKLAQAVILKEIQKFHQTQSANTLFSTVLTPEIPPAVCSRVTDYVRRYMESKGPLYHRRIQQTTPLASTRPEETNLRPDPYAQQYTSSNLQSRPLPHSIANRFHTNHIESVSSQCARPH